MRKWLIGPLLSAAACLSGAYYGAETQQLVHKGPGSTYEAVAHAFDGIPRSGMTYFKGGTPIPYEIRMDRESSERLVVHVLFDGKEGATTEFRFTPRDNGESTLVTAKAHGSYDVLHTALSGTSNSALAYAPDWMINTFALKPQLSKVAAQIEAGQKASMDGFQSPAEWESSLSPDKQKEVQEWRQDQATRPEVNPDADAQRYMSGNAD